MPAAGEPRQNGAHHSEAPRPGKPHQGKPQTGLEIYSGTDRASRAGQSERRREINSNINSILDYSKNTFYIMPSI
jgi:hypothetical protein